MIAAAHAVLHDTAAAEDVVHDVFAGLWSRPASYDASRGGLRGYLTLLARSRALDRWRTRAARTAAIDRTAQAEALRPEPEQPDDVVVRRDLAAQAIGALEALPQPQRAALLLTYGAGLSTHEMAKAVEVPLGTAKSRVRLGLQRARQLVDPDELPRAA